MATIRRLFDPAFPPVFDRAGVPLLEIVTEPDLRSAAEAEAFLRSLVAMLT